VSSSQYDPELHVADGLIDSHVHLLLNEVEYPWMVDDVTQSLKGHDLLELEAEFSLHEVRGGVVVQAIGDARETATLLELTARTPNLLGVVGWLDLSSPSVDEELNALALGQYGEWLVGLRHQTHDESDANWLTRTDVLRGLEKVAALGLPFDLLIRTREITAACSVAATFPDLKLVVDHLAKPPVNGVGIEAWDAGLASLASFSNTYCKLSGLVTEVAPLGAWSSELLAPMLQRALNYFGPDRCLFGSDWPVCRLAATYTEVVELALRALKSLTSAEKHAVLRLNAIRLYDLDFPPRVCV
jgi:L-fucono-1,5-lactonase